MTDVFEALDAVIKTSADDLARALPDFRVSGVTLVGLADADDGFVCPFYMTSSEELIAQSNPFERQVMAVTLRGLADRWEPKP